jgi:acetylornithine deacetylase/succinyl-diaminopimelate desuccinylase-like protein
MSSPAVEYARQNQPRFLSELKDLLRIPSVSTLPQHKTDIGRAADFLAAQMRAIGLGNGEVIGDAG